MKKIIFIFLFLFAFAVPCSALTYYDDNGFYTFESLDYNSSLNNWFPLSSPVYPDSVTIPSNYSPVGYCATHNNTYRFNLWLYADLTNGYPVFSINSSDEGFTLRSSGSSIFAISNRYSKFDTTGDSRVYNYSQNYQPFTFGGDCKACFFVPVVDSNGNTIQPENLVNFSLNTFIDNSDYTLRFNSTLNSGDGSMIDYYIFPSTADIPTGVISTPISNVPVTELTEQQKHEISLKGYFQFLDDTLNKILGTFVPSVSLSSSNSVPSSSFNPDSFNVPYVNLGRKPLYSGSNATVSGVLSLKDIISNHSGVYAYSPLKLVAVCHLQNRFFVATFDFNPSAIVGSSPVPPTTIQGQVPYPDFDNQNSDFKDLADYLKDLMQANNDNSIRNDQNFIANLMAIPWANFVGTGFSAKLPELSFYLDSLFDSLFDKFTAPTEEQINALYDDIQIERNSIKSKLAFASDVKAELYFIISTITADNNTVPPKFEINLPSSLFGGHQVRTVDLMSYEIATPFVVGIIKDIITVFLSLGLVLHVWRTLPSTIGNMPRGDE